MTPCTICSISLVSLNMLDIVTSKVLDNPVILSVLYVKMLDDFKVFFLCVVFVLVFKNYYFFKYVSLPIFFCSTDDFFSKRPSWRGCGCCLDVTPCLASRSRLITLLGCLSHLLSTRPVFAPHCTRIWLSKPGPGFGPWTLSLWKGWDTSCLICY